MQATYEQSTDRMRFAARAPLDHDDPLNTPFTEPASESNPSTPGIKLAQNLTSMPTPATTEKPGFRIFGFSIRNAAILFAGLWSTVSAGIYGNRLVQEHDLRPAAAARLDPEQATPAWPVHTHVLASTTQNELSYFYDSYTSRLATQIRNNALPSLQAAQQELENNTFGSIYRIGPQLPVSTPRDTDAFVKGVSADRKVLFLSGSAEGGPTRNFLSFGDERRFLNQVRTLESALADTYHIDSDAFHRLHTPTVNEIIEMLDTIAQSSSGDTEILIYIAAHGDRTEGQPATLQGAHNGSVYFREDEALNEGQLKQLIHDKFAHVANVTIIIDACYSGAFIS